MAVIGPDTPALGEVKEEGQLYQKQVATTLASFLGLSYASKSGTDDVIKKALKAK
jgi:hypothetical protein